MAAALFCASILASYANGMAAGWYAPLTTRQPTDELWTLLPQTVDQIAAVSISAADRGLLAVAGWLGVMLVTAEGLRSWGDVERLVKWITWFGAAVAAIGIVQFVTGINVVGYITIPGLRLNADLEGVGARSVLNRPSSTAVHPIEFGVVLACVFSFALHRMIFDWGKRGALVPAAFIFVGASMSVSRSAVLALSIGGLVLFLGWPSAWRMKALIYAPLAVVGLRLAVPGLVGTIISLFTNLGNDPSIDGRTSDYGVVLDLVGDHPLLGRGLYTFIPRNYRIIDNQWLGILVELGAIGFVACLAFLLMGFLCARSAVRRAVTARQRHLGLAISASIAGAAVSMVTYDAWGYPMHSGLVFMMLGFSGAVWRLSRQDRDHPEEPSTSARADEGAPSRTDRELVPSGSH